MAAITLSTFRLVTGLQVSDLPDLQAVWRIRSGSAVAARVCGRCFGHAIERIDESGSDVRIKVYGHGLPTTGKIWISGIGQAAIDGEQTYTVVDQDTLQVAGKGLVGDTAVVDRGRISVAMTCRSRVIGSEVDVYPGIPVSVVSVTDDQGDVLPSTLYRLVGDVVELYVDKRGYRREPRMIRPIRQASMSAVDIVYYAGMLQSLPDDLAGAIATIGNQTAAINASTGVGVFQSENHEDYSYQLMPWSEAAKLPTTAMATLSSYRAKVPSGVMSFAPC